MLQISDIVVVGPTLIAKFPHSRKVVPSLHSGHGAPWTVSELRANIHTQYIMPLSFTFPAAEHSHCRCAKIQNTDTHTGTPAVGRLRFAAARFNSGYQVTSKQGRQSPSREVHNWKLDSRAARPRRVATNLFVPTMGPPCPCSD